MAFPRRIVKRPNKQIKRRLEGLTSKAFQYGNLEGVECCLLINYPRKGTFYSYRSSKQLSWLRNLHEMVSGGISSSVFRSNPRSWPTPSIHMSIPRT